MGIPGHGFNAIFPSPTVLQKHYAFLEANALEWDLSEEVLNMRNSQPLPTESLAHVDDKLHRVFDELAGLRQADAIEALPSSSSSSSKKRTVGSSSAVNAKKRRLLKDNIVPETDEDSAEENEVVEIVTEAHASGKVCLEE